MVLATSATLPSTANASVRGAKIAERLPACASLHIPTSIPSRHHAQTARRDAPTTSTMTSR
jgi:hypothetical protein